MQTQRHQAETKSIKEQLTPRNLALTGAAVAGLLTAAGVHKASHESFKSNREAEAIQKIDKEKGDEKFAGVVVARPGTIYRSAPLMEESTIVSKVPEGQGMLIPGPVKVEMDGDTWYSFQFGGADKTSDDKIDQAVEKTLWINATQLQGETDKTGKAFLEMFPNYTDYAKDHDAHIGANGVYQDETGNEVAVATLMPLADAENLAKVHSQQP